MSLKKIGKISHSVPEISLSWPNFSKVVGKLTDKQTYMKFRIFYNGVPPKEIRKISHTEIDISLY